MFRNVQIDALPFPVKTQLELLFLVQIVWYPYTTLYFVIKDKKVNQKKVLEHLDLTEKVVHRFHEFYKFRNMLFVKLPFPVST